MNKFLLQHRRGTTDKWMNSNVILRDGEIGIERCDGTVKLKVGDGESKYSDLPYGASIAIDQISESSLDDGYNVITFSDGKTLNVKNGSKGEIGKSAAPIFALPTATKISMAQSELVSGKYPTDYAFGVVTVSFGSYVKGDFIGITPTDATVLFNMDGKDGYTPVRGEDYWREEDKQAIIDELKTYIDNQLATMYGEK